jgi:hypothetical protein
MAWESGQKAGRGDFLPTGAMTMQSEQINDSARCEGIMQAYDALRDRLDETDRKILLDMARLALLGEGNEPNS